MGVLLDLKGPVLTGARAFREGVRARPELGQADKAKELYERVAKFTIHNPTGAYAIPLAKEKLGTSE